MNENETKESSDLFLPGGLYSTWLPIAETKGK